MEQMKTDHLGAVAVRALGAQEVREGKVAGCKEVQTGGTVRRSK